jgi:allantoin racemase
MKVLVLNPNTSSEMTASIDQVARQYARTATEIVSWNPDRGPLSIEGAYDRQIAIEASLEKVLRSKEHFDSYIIACFGDPGLQAFREALDANVLGIAESAMLTACTLGSKFSILSVLARSKPSGENLVHQYGLQDRCASVRATGLSVLEVHSNRERLITRLTEEGKKAIEDDGAEVLLLGCAGMAGVDKMLQSVLKVPVLDGVVCAVKLAESLYDYGLKTSKVGFFKTPEKKKYLGLWQGVRIPWAE